MYRGVQIKAAILMWALFRNSPDAETVFSGSKTEAFGKITPIRQIPEILFSLTGTTKAHRESRTVLLTMWVLLRKSRTDMFIRLKEIQAIAVQKDSMLSDTMKYSDSEYRRIKTDATRTEMFGWHLFLFYALRQSDKVIKFFITEPFYKA